METSFDFMKTVARCKLIENGLAPVIAGPVLKQFKYGFSNRLRTYTFPCLAVFSLDRHVFDRVRYFTRILDQNKKKEEAHTIRRNKSATLFTY